MNILMGPTAFVVGCVTLITGWWLLCGCSGIWPDDRNRIIGGIPLCIVGACSIIWSIPHIDPALTY